MEKMMKKVTETFLSMMQKRSHNGKSSKCSLTGLWNIISSINMFSTDQKNLTNLLRIKPFYQENGWKVEKVKIWLAKLQKR